MFTASFKSVHTAHQTQGHCGTLEILTVLSIPGPDALLYGFGHHGNN